MFFALLSYQPAMVLFAGFVVYALSGYVGSACVAEAAAAPDAAPR